MAYVANDEDDEQKNQPSGQGPVSPTGSGGVHLAPSSGVGATAPGGSTGGSGGTAGGQFASLNQYLSANQGQAAPLANKITDTIGQQYNSLDQANQGVLSDIQGQVTSAPGYTASDSGLVSKESADPTSFASDPNNVASFQKQLTDSYGGPNSAEGQQNFLDQQSAVNTAIANGQAQTQTQAGQQQLVAQNSAAPTAGVTALNSAILSQDPTYLGQVQNAYQPFQNLVSNLSTGAQGIDKTIANETQDAKNASQNSLNAITGQETNLNNTVNNELTSAQATGTAQNATIKNDVASGNLSATDLQALGMTQDQWNGLSAADKAAATSQLVNSQNGQFSADTGTANIDNTQFLTQQDPNAVYNVNNVATQNDYNQAGAFQTLLNGLNLQTPTLSINPANSSMAGTAPTNLSSFDQGTALTTAQQTSAAEQAAAQAYVAALQSGASEQNAQEAAQKAQQSATIQGIASLGNPAMGAAVGGINGQISAAKNFISDPSIKTAIAAPQTVAKDVVAGVNDAVKTVTNIFCFHPWTLIEMADGSLMPIYKLMVGDNTRGGKILATTRGVGTQFYWYNGVLVTGKHAVREDGWWIRVENSKQAKKFNYLTEVVCNLVTESHRIWSNGNEFADEHETDQYEYLNLDDSLAEMNKRDAIC